MSGSTLLSTSVATRVAADDTVHIEARLTSREAPDLRLEVEVRDLRQEGFDAAMSRPLASSELFDVARTAWSEAGKPKPHLATSFWFAMGEGDGPRAQVHRHLRRYMNWIPAEFVDAMAPTTGWAGGEDELRDVLRTFEAIGTDEVHLIPTSSDVDQLRRVADVAKDFA